MLLLHPYSLVDTWIDTAVTPWPSHGMDTVPSPYIGQCDVTSVEYSQIWLFWYSTFKFQSSAGQIRHLIQWSKV